MKYLLKGAAIAGLVGAGFVGGMAYEGGFDQTSPAEVAGESIDKIAKDCGDLALQEVLAGANVDVSGQISDEQQAVINDLQAQVEAKQQACFTENAGTLVSGIELQVPAVNVRVIVNNG